MRFALITADGRHLVEKSPHDATWGIDLHSRDPQIANTKKRTKAGPKLETLVLENLSLRMFDYTSLFVTVGSSNTGCREISRYLGISLGYFVLGVFWSWGVMHLFLGWCSFFRVASWHLSFSLDVIKTCF